MELKLDTSKTYAIALEGGGAKGAYEIGVWKALEQAGVKYNAVSGTSVGALNGALMAMRDLPRAIDCWSNIRPSQVIDLGGVLMEPGQRAHAASHPRHCLLAGHPPEQGDGPGRPLGGRRQADDERTV